ncbi:GNAT family N-acetyltransferase [Halobacillus litoralis]|uniref:GNAT family N-acetyltransferase n=1 Tax=Halobacillus litoralis TaxID=45668 RepID=UPI001CFDAEA2|nr:GNAT family N-acetyltransferase [Halobacillus litoralis]
MSLQTIRAVEPGLYNSVQLNAWFSSLKENPSVYQRLKNAYSLAAKEDGHIIGMASLLDGDLIDFLYIHKDYQRHGIATELLNRLEKKALEKGNIEVYTEASLIAVPFFKKRGYHEKLVQTKYIKGISIKNVQMCRKVNN